MDDTDAGTPGKTAPADVTAIWADSVSPDTAPGTTIRGQGAIPTETPKRVVNPRKLTQQGEPPPLIRLRTAGRETTRGDGLLARLQSGRAHAGIHEWGQDGASLAQPTAGCGRTGARVAARAGMQAVYPGRDAAVSVK
jgi:hypothetical protein